jgi:hypothetical protein
MECTFCGRSFNSRKALLNHTKDVHDWVPCLICGQCYRTKDSFFEHFYAVHKTEKVSRQSSRFRRASPSEVLREKLKNIYDIDENDLDPNFDHHYEDCSSDVEMRGGERFFVPSFCTKIALNVMEKYSRSTWLHPDHGWPVVYHGTPASNAGSIIRNGLCINGGNLSPPRGAVYGRGVYVSPRHEVRLRILRYPRSVPNLPDVLSQP